MQLRHHKQQTNLRLPRPEEMFSTNLIDCWPLMGSLRVSVFRLSLAFSPTLLSGMGRDAITFFRKIPVFWCGRLHTKGRFFLKEERMLFIRRSSIGLVFEVATVESENYFDEIF